jgi:hypothetical protein
VLLAEWLLPANTCSLSGTGNPRVPVTRSGTGMDTNLYPSAGMGFLTDVFFLRGHGYGLVVPSGYVPVAILTHGFLDWEKIGRAVLRRHIHIRTLLSIGLHLWPCLVSDFSPKFHYAKRRFLVISKCRQIHRVLNVDEIKN